MKYKLSWDAIIQNQKWAALRPHLQFNMYYSNRNIQHYVYRDLGFMVTINAPKIIAQWRKEYSGPRSSPLMTTFDSRYLDIMINP